MSEDFSAQSTKEAYRTDIESSRKINTVYKHYEYYDDHSYSNSTKMGMFLNKRKGKIFLTLFQNDGPKDKQTLRKMFEWRRSGSSTEIGHKGGGNKRNIYGFLSDCTILISKISPNEVIYSETFPNKIYNLSNTNITETEFRKVSDTSEYIKVPENKEIEDLPKWYDDLCNEIKRDSGIEANYLIRMELTDVPIEFTDNQEWNKYKHQVGAKQYKIPILLKNELLSEPMKTYELNPNIDLVGFNDSNKLKQIKQQLYINKDATSVYLENGDNEYINVKDSSNKLYSKELLEWGTIDMFIVSEHYAKRELAKYNKDVGDRLTGEDLYGAYFLINNKLTNYIPIAGKDVGSGKTNSIINNEDGTHSSSNRFRMIFKPNEDTCANSKYFDALVNTSEIKALSGFLDRSPSQEIARMVKKLYKGIAIESTKKSEPTAKKKDTTLPKNKGGFYVVYLGGSIYKFGCVETYNNLNSRISDHLRESIEKVKHFTNGRIVQEKQCALKMYELSTHHPKGCEEKCMNLLRTYGGEVVLFENRGNANGCREYFKCDNIDFVYQNIIPKVEEEIKHL